MNIPGDLAAQVRTGRIPALSIRQPYPHHIFHDGKDVENRSWRSAYLGWIMVHAGKSIVEDPEMIRRLDLPLGGIVGMVRITGCTAVSSSNWFFGPFAFKLVDAFPIPLVPCAGKQGFFRVDVATREAVAAAITKVRA